MCLNLTLGYLLLLFLRSYEYILSKAVYLGNVLSDFFLFLYWKIENWLSLGGYGIDMLGCFKTFLGGEVFTKYLFKVPRILWIATKAFAQEPFRRSNLIGLHTGCLLLLLSKFLSKMILIYYYFLGQNAYK